MTIAQLTASLSGHPPLNTSLRDHTGGNSPIVATTAPRTSVELEGNVNGDMAQGLTCSPPKRATTAGSTSQQSDPKTSWSWLSAPMSKNTHAPHQWIRNSFTIFVQDLKQITQDTWTLQTIQGNKIPFCRRPRQWRMRITRVKCHSDAHHMEIAMKDLLEKGAVREVWPQDDQFTSTLFLVQKGNGDYRPNINRRALNRFLGKESFKMEELQVVKSFMRQGYFMMKLDLKDAYYAIPIQHSHRK